MEANTVLVHSLVNLALRIAVSLVRLPSLTRPQREGWERTNLYSAVTLSDRSAAMEAESLP